VERDERVQIREREGGREGGSEGERGRERGREEKDHARPAPPHLYVLMRRGERQGEREWKR
jgi:hypothetical protein